jgi:small subunit ribosomal protein S20
MPHSKSAQKRLIQNEKARVRNKSLRTGMKTAIKKVTAAIAAGDLPTATKMLPDAMQSIDKAAKKHAIHQNAAARKKSQIARAAKPKPSA